MRKILLYFSLLLMIFLVGCSSSDKSQEEIWLLSSTDNSLRAEIFAIWTSYVDILGHTLAAKSPEDHSYIVGRIDGPLLLKYSEITRIKSLSNISQEHVDTIITKELQEPLYKLIENVGLHLGEIKSSIEENKLDDIHTHDKQLQEIINAIKELNDLSSNYLIDSSESVKTLEIVQNCNMVIEELLTQLQTNEK